MRPSSAEPARRLASRDERDTMISAHVPVNKENAEATRQQKGPEEKWPATRKEERAAEGMISTPIEANDKISHGHHRRY
jgi:hypothetical protein